MPTTLPGKPGLPPYTPTSGGPAYQLTAQDRQDLAFLSGRRTLYEVEIVRAHDQTRALLCFTHLRSERALMDAILDRADLLLAWLGEAKGALLVPKKHGGWPGVAFRVSASLVRYTGRTKRDVIWDGPARRLPSLKSLMATN